MKKDLLIKNGLVVFSTGPVPVDIAVDEGKISGIFSSGDAGSADEVIDAAGMLVLPGVVDSHVHFNEPGRESWEGFKTGSMGAAAGGITTVIDMPLNSQPCTINATELQRKVQAGECNSIIDFGLWGGVVPSNLDELEGLHQGGVVGFKGFLSNSGIDDFASLDDGALFEALRRVAEIGSLLGLHAESDTLVSHHTEYLRSSGRCDRRAFLESRPPLAEIEAVRKALLLAEYSGAAIHLHFLHTTVATNVEAIVRARVSGLQTTVETCPHYLTLTDEDLIRIGPTAKCAPPLRSRGEQEAMWQLLKRGWIDVLGSDHSPCTVEAKERGAEDIWQAWGGISGHQFMLPLMFFEGVVRRGLQIQRLVELVSSTPAQLFRLSPRKGTIQVGSDADLVIFDPSKRWTIRQENILYKNKHTPYHGRELQGSVEATLLRGNLIYRTGQVLGMPGTGRYVKHESFGAGDEGRSR